MPVVTLIRLILGSLLSSTVDGIIGEELEQIGIKEKEAKNG